MDELAPATAGLSEAKRRLLERRRNGGAATAASSGIPRRDARVPAPLSPAQHNVWLADRLRPDAALYHVYRLIRLNGPLDRPALEFAVKTLVDRHEILRTVYRRTKEDGLVQVPSDDLEVELRLRDIEPGTTASRSAAAVELAAALVSEPFDLETGPLFRADLLPVGEEEHLLLLRMHHILTDEWSCGLLPRELGRIYSAATTGTEANLEPLGIQYADYAAWLNRPEQVEHRESQLRYWKRAMEGSASVLELPTDRTRPAAPTHRGASVSATFSLDATARLLELSHASGSTLYSLLLTLFSAALQRYSGQDTFAVGTLLSGRGSPQTEHLLGMFANTVALPIDLSGDPSVSDAVRRIGASVIEALDHQEVGFDSLVSALGLPRDASRNPLFQVLYQCFEAAEQTWEFAGLDCEPIGLESSLSKVDLAFQAIHHGGGISLELVYATDLYTEDTARALLGHVQALAERAVSTPDARLRDLPLLTSEEHHRAVDVWNDTRFEYPVDATVHGLVEIQADAEPEAIAIWDADGGTVTFGELERSANRLAHFLRSRGVGRESLVGVCFDHSVDMFTALLGVLKAGGAYVPLDAGLPEARAQWILEDTAAPLVVTSVELRDRIPAAYTGEVLCIEDLYPELAELPDSRLEPVSDSDNLLYIIYTSGSTGRPKGVQVPHRGVVNYLWWAVEGYGLESGEKGAPMLGSIAFDLSVPNFWLPLIGGNSVTLLPTDNSLEALAKTLGGDEDFSLLKSTPGHLDVLRSLLEHDSVHSVRTFVVGADEVRPETVAGWRRVAPDARIINEYGPTETVVGCSVYPIPEDFDASSSVSIGWPIGNLRMYVLDAALNPLPPGVVGELYIGGDGVARGYLNRPALTAEKFIPDPFGGPGDRLYRTGDLARWRSTGDFDFLGRNDFQVKIRGYRIELGEVESRLGSHPAVTEAVASAVTDKHGHKRLVGYVVLDPSLPAPDSAELRAYVGAELPEYMVPALFHVLDAMPLTPAGKVDRTALPRPGARQAVKSDFQTPVERTLAAIWREALSLPSVDREDNFFELGGDSILAITVVRRAAEAGLAMAPVDLFRHQTIADLAKACVPAVPEPADAIVPAPPTDRFSDADLPRSAVTLLRKRFGDENIARIRGLSPLQEGMLFHSIGGEDGHYTEVFAYRVSGRFDQSAFQTAWDTLAHRHDAMRTVFAWEGLPRPVQIVLTEAAVPLDVLDWAGEHPAQQEPRLRRLVARMQSESAPLEAELSTRVTVVRHSKESWSFTWRIHHAILDGLSVSLLLDELYGCYRSLVEGRGLPDLPDPVSGTDYLAWIDRHSDPADYGYWAETLRGLDAPTPLPAGTASSLTGVGRITRSSDESTAKAIRDLARAHKVTVGAVVHAAWGLLLAHHAGTERTVFGTTVSGRSHAHPDARHAVGMLMNTLPFHTSIDHPDLASWLRHVHHTFADVREHEQHTLTDIHRHSPLANHQPLFNTILVFDNFENAGSSASGFAPLELDDGINTSYGCVLDAIWYGSLTLRLNYDRALYSEADAEALLDQLGLVLSGIPEHLDRTPRDLAARLLPRVDRNAPVPAAPDAHRPSGAAPRTPAERLLAAIWADVLDLPSVGVHDDYFSLGGDSLLAIQVAVRARQAGLALQPTSLFRHPTVAELARNIAPADPEPAPVHPTRRTFEDGLGDAERARLDAEHPGAIAVARTTPLQTGMLFHALDAPEDYIKVFGYTVEGALHIEAFREAWRAVVKRHEALRTVFAWSGLPHPVQLIVEEATPIALLDWRTVPEHRRERRLKDLLAVRGPAFRLDEDPPSEMTVVDFGGDAWAFLWRVHHVLVDGISSDTVIDELYGCYRSLVEGRGLPDLPDPVSGTDYLAWIDRHSDPADYGYWAETLRGLDAPTPLPAGTASSLTGVGRITRSSDESTAKAIRDLARAHKVTVGAVVHAAWGLLLAHHAGTERTVFGTTVSGRSHAHPDARHAVGMLMNTLPFHTSIDHPDLASWLRHVHHTFADVREHEQHTLTDIHRHSPLPNHQPLFNTILVFESLTASSAAEGLLPLNADEGMATGYQMVLDAFWHERLILRLNYDRSRYSGEDADRLLRQLVDLIDGLARAPRNTTPADVARSSLAEPPAASAAPSSPANTAEIIAEVWSEAFGTPDIGAEDDYFELGGDSLLAIRIVAESQKRGLDLKTRHLLGLRTPAAIAAAIEDGAGQVRAPSTPASPGVDAAADAPLSSMQAGMLFQTLLEPESKPYHEQDVFTLKGTLAEREFAAAWAHTIGRHEALRSVFVWEDRDEPAQSISPSARFQLAVHDWSNRRDADADLNAWLQSEQDRPFDLDKLPPHRFALFRLSDEHRIFVWQRHHIQLDAWSTAAVLRDALDAYEDLRSGRAPATPRAASNLNAVLRSLESRRSAEDTAFWSTTLAGAEPTPAPGDGSGAGPAGTRGAFRTLGSDVTARLRQLARGHHATLASVFHLAWAQCLTGGSGDAVFGTSLTGRSVDPLVTGDAIGNFMTTLPFRARLDDTESLSERIARVHETLLSLQEREHCSLTDVARWSGSASAARLFDTILVCAQTTEAAGAGDGLAIEPHELTTTVGTGYPVLCSVQSGTATALGIRYQTDRLSDEAAEALLESFASTLESFVDETPEDAAPPHAVAALTDIWRAVLGEETLDSDSDFFAHGGDSILAIRVLSRARRAGLPMDLKALFEHRTPAATAAHFADSPNSAAISAPPDSAGPVPLTPILHWFTRLQVPHDHYNQSALLESSRIDAALLAPALDALVRHHEALRSRLRRDGDAWAHTIERSVPPVPIKEIDARTSSADERDRVLSAAADTAHAGLDLADGPLMRAVLLHAKEKDYLLLAVHHAAIDIVSWGILLEDLETAYEQLREGEAVSLPPVPTPYNRWAKELHRYSVSDAFTSEREYWEDRQAYNADLPVDHHLGANTEDSTAYASGRLDRTQTAGVLRAAAGLGVGVVNAITAALVHTVADWTGIPEVRIDIEGHGREAIAQDLDLSRTIGWFTSVRPLEMTVDEDLAGTTARVAAIGEAYPHHGIGFGIHRYLGRADDDHATADLVFNYHGRSGGSAAEGRFRPADGPHGVSRAPGGLRPYLVEVDAAISNGELQVYWKYSGNRHRHATAQAMVDSVLQKLAGFPTARAADPGRTAVSVLDIGTVFPDNPALKLIAKRHAIPGMGIGSLSSGRALASWGQGVIDTSSGEPVGPDTVFQLGSASKMFSAMAVLRLAARGAVELDRAVDAYLTGWKTGNQATVRHLLEHKAGLTVVGYEGYRPGDPFPTLQHSLNGQDPATTPRVRPELAPGQAFRYSGAHYTVLQQMVEQVTGTTFREALQELVLAPLGLSRTFCGEPATAGSTALAHDTTGAIFPGGWRNIPEHAAAGIWSAPGDVLLALDAIDRSYRAEDATFLPTEMTRAQFGHEDGRPALATYKAESPGYLCAIAAEIGTGTALVALGNAHCEDSLYEDLFGLVLTR
jgi:amino acid adenylation domain-containing protein/non-ribosomal peptide synthase protein (TIGR01720 family)